MTAISDKYAQLGGAGGWLGSALGAETACGEDDIGRFRNYQHGAIYWHPDVDRGAAHEVHGLILAKWRALAAEAGDLGFPRTDERIPPDGTGRVSWFGGGMVFWHPAHGVFEVHGEIAGKYASLGGPSGPLGYPTSDESGTLGNGRFNTFQHGAIYWTPAIGAHEIHGAIYAKWKTLGLAGSALGFPVTDEYPAAIGDGRVSRFQSGGIVWTSSTGAQVVP